MYTEEFEAGNPFYLHSIDAQFIVMFIFCFPEFDDHLLCLLCVEVPVVVPALHGECLDLLPVSYIIAVGDQTNDGRVIR